MMKFRKKSKQVQPENWSRFRRWRHSRPFTGSLWMMVAGILVLWGPISLFRLAVVPGSTIWAGLLLGGLLFLMGLLPLFVPSYALMAGAIGVVLSLVSLPVGGGGFLIGMILGLIGGALSVAWKPTVYHLRSNTTDPAPSGGSSPS